MPFTSCIGRQVSSDNEFNESKGTPTENETVEKAKQTAIVKVASKKTYKKRLDVAQTSAQTTLKKSSLCNSSQSQ